MVDWGAWLPGLPNDPPEDDPVQKALGLLGQGAQAVSSGLSSAAASATSALGFGQADVSATPQNTPDPVGGSQYAVGSAEPPSAEDQPPTDNRLPPTGPPTAEEESAARTQWLGSLLPQPTATESSAVQAGLDAMKAAEPAGPEFLPTPIRQAVGSGLGATQVVQAAADAVKARIDPRVWGFAHDGIARTELSPEEWARYNELGGAVDPATGQGKTSLTPAEQREYDAIAAQVEQKYQQIKDDPDALTRYAHASPAYGPVAGLTDMLVAPAVGGLAAQGVRGAAAAAGAGPRAAEALGYGADVLGQSVVDPTNLAYQPAADAVGQGLRGVGAARRALGGGDVAPELANALPTIQSSGRATTAAIGAAPLRAAVGAAGGGVTGATAGYESAPEDASPLETAGRTLAGGALGAAAGATLAGAGTVAAGKLVDSLVASGRLDPAILASHPQTADRVRALFSLAAEGLPDGATVAVPDMVSAMARMRPRLAEQVPELLSGPVTAGEVRAIAGAADSPGVVRTMQEMAVDALTGLGARARRGRETAADVATVRGISAEARRTAAGRARETASALPTKNGPALPVDPERQPELSGLVNDLADRLGIERPQVYLSDSPAVNASATTRDGGGNALIINRGLLNAGLTDAELEAVLTHELAHTGQDTRNPVSRVLGGVSDALGSTQYAVGSGEAQPPTANRLPPTAGGAHPLRRNAPGVPPLAPQVQQYVQQAQAGAGGSRSTPGLSPLQWTRRLAGEVGYSSMIGPATFSVNVLGNMMEPLWSIPKEGARAVARAVGTGNLSALREPGEMAKGIFQGGVMHGLGQVGTAMVDALAARGQYAATPGHAPLSAVTSNPIGKAITTGLEAGGRVFSALPDAVFGTVARGAGEARTAAQIATDQGLTGARWKAYVDTLLSEAERVRTTGSKQVGADTQRVIDGGIAYGKRQTFQDDLGTYGSKARDFAKVGNMPVVGNLVTPFFNTPWNMNLRMLERTPAGLAMHSQGSRFDKYYDATVGSALLVGLAAGPVASGAITGGGPDDPAKKAEMRSQGWRPYSTLIGGVYVPNRVFGVYAPVLNAAADVHDSIAYSKDGSPASIASNYVGRLGAQIQQQPYLQGISNIMQAIQANQGGGLGNAAENYAASTLTRLVPYAATGRFVGTALDPNERTIDRGKNVPAATTIAEQVQQGVGLRGGLPVAQDVLGRPLENPQQGAGAAFAKTSPERADPIIQTFLDNGVDIGFPKTEVTISRHNPQGQVIASAPVPFTRPEGDEWNRLRGEALTQLTQGALSNPNFAAASPEARQKYLQEKLAQANDHADAAIKAQIGTAELLRRYDQAILQKAS